MPKEDGDLEGIKLILDEWKTVITTQMHFNEMIIRTRAIGVSVVIGVYGAAALALGQYPDKFLPISTRSFHVSAPIIIFGLLLLVSIFSLDYFYYYRLLLGAVKRGEEIDKAYENRIIDGTRPFGMTKLISKEVSRRCTAVSIFVFYGIPFLAGIVSLIYLLWLYCS